MSLGIVLRPLHHPGVQPPGPVVGSVGHPGHVARWHRRRRWSSGRIQLLQRHVLLQRRLVGDPTEVEAYHVDRLKITKHNIRTTISNYY